MHSSINQDQLLKETALAFAQNAVGAMRSEAEVLVQEGLTPTEYAQIAKDPRYAQYLEAYTAELRNNGFSFSAKCKVLAEDLLPTLYHMARDADTPAKERVRIVESMVTWADLAPKNNAAIATGPGFSITINIPGAAPTTISANARTPAIDAEDAKLTIPTAPAKRVSPILLDEPDDYEYAGADYYK